MIGAAQTFVIAEAGVNHNGSLASALELVEVAAQAGADAVKFQTFSADQLASATVAKAHYQQQTTGAGESQHQMLRKLELDRSQHETIAAHCRSRGIAFMSTAFDADSLRLLGEFEMPAYKVSSGDLTAAPLLLQFAQRGAPIILSTGMGTLAEIESALGVLAFGYLEGTAAAGRDAFEAAYCSAEGQGTLERNVVLLHCVTQYPSPLADVNLRALDTLRQAFGLRVGYSDHTLGMAAALAAVARGACVIEKHFTLDRSLPGPDHRASLEPAELTAMVAAIRDIEAALGSPRKVPVGGEWANREVARRGLVAACAIGRGELFSEHNVALKRAGGGIAPILYWDLLGTAAARDFEPDEPLQL